MPSFGKRLYMADLERELSSNYMRARKEKRLDLNLAETQILSPWSLAVLFSWATDEIHHGGTVRVVPPASGYAARLVDSSGFSNALRRLGASVIGSQVLLWDKKRLSVFETFSSLGEFEKYAEDLEDERKRLLLLQADELPEIVISGEFHKIALRELVDNVFTHGGECSCFYCATQVDEVLKDGRGQHTIFSGLHDAAYLELCVGDASGVSIPSTLKSQEATSFNPGEGLETANPTKHERRLAYAFEYGSTSKPQEREKKIARWLAGREGEVAQIATGLYNVKELAAEYGGQVIVRSAGRIGTIDFSRSDPESRHPPRIAFWRPPVGQGRPAHMKGSIVCLRLPLHRIDKRLHVVSVTQTGKAPAKRSDLPPMKVLRPHGMKMETLQ